MKQLSLYLVLLLLPLSGMAQEKVGERWVDNALSFKVEFDEVKKSGIFGICIYSTARAQCIENLTSGFFITLKDASGKVLWTGKSMGRHSRLQLPKAFPTASTLELTAFKPYVINKNTGTRIHQEKPITLTYRIP